MPTVFFFVVGLLCGGGFVVYCFKRKVDTQRHENGLSWEKENDVEDTAVKIPGQIRSLTYTT